VVGLLQQDAGGYLKRGVAAASLTDADIDARLAERKAARADKNFAESDRLRDELLAAGIVLEDKPGGLTEWRRT
jgi:cysteinyl-tRNA synthetase